MADPTYAPPPNLFSTAPTQSTFMGVPAGYQPPTLSSQFGQGAVTGTGRPLEDTNYGQQHGSLLYKPGDELLPLQNPELIPQLQVQLVQAGLLAVKSVRPGQWGSAEQAAYKHVLEFANQRGINAQQALSAMTSSPTIGQLQQQAGASQRTFSTDNPVDVAATAQDSAVKLMGRRLDPNEEKAITQFVTMSQEAEANAARNTKQDYTSQASGTGLVDKYLRQNDQSDIVGFNAVQAMHSFYDLLKTPVGP